MCDLLLNNISPRTFNHSYSSWFTYTSCTSQVFTCLLKRKKEKGHCLSLKVN